MCNVHCVYILLGRSRMYANISSRTKMIIITIEDIFKSIRFVNPYLALLLAKYKITVCSQGSLAAMEIMTKLVAMHILCTTQRCSATKEVIITALDLPPRASSVCCSSRIHLQNHFKKCALLSFQAPIFLESEE